MSKISLSVPSFNGNEWKYVKECIDSEWVSSAGKFVGIITPRQEAKVKSGPGIA